MNIKLVKSDRYVLLLVLSFAVIIGLNSCKNRDPKTPSVSAAAIPTYFYSLTMSDQQYRTLQGYFNGQGDKRFLVFQFFYPAETKGGSPTLYSYAVDNKRNSVEKPAVILDYKAVSKEPLTGRAQVLGDLQLRMKDLDELYKQILPINKDKKHYFLFAPKFRATNPHVYYSVTLNSDEINNFVGYPASIDVDPSPPARSIFE